MIPRECRNCASATDNVKGVFCEARKRVMKKVKRPCALKSGKFDESFPMKKDEWEIKTSSFKCEYKKIDKDEAAQILRRLYCELTNAHCNLFNCPIKVED